MSLDLPLIWTMIIALGVFFYVVLDGFDLGIGILFPLASPKERDQMMASIAPVWDGNETWLILGGGGLLAAFPLAYAVVMPAFYLPIGFMLIALVFRGVAFEFRLHAGQSGKGKQFWTFAFWAGSLVAALSQGLVLGGLIHGVKVVGRQFAGGPFDWLTPYSLLVALGVAVGYALLGACWLIFKTKGELNQRANLWAKRLFLCVAVAMFSVSLATLSIDPRVSARWGLSMSDLDLRAFLPAALAPILAGLGLLVGYGACQPHKNPLRPYLSALIIFVAGFAGLALSVFPYLVPFAITFRQAAASESSLGLMLVGVSIFLPLILGYTAYVYWLFRAKVDPDAAYH